MSKKLLSPQIDYLNHPGFSHMAPAKVDNAADTEFFFEQAEKEFATISYMPLQSSHELKAQIEMRLGPIHAEMRKYSDSYMRDSAAFKPLLFKALDDYLLHMGHELAFINGKKKRQDDGGSGSERKKDLLEKGFSLFQLDDKILGELWRSIPDWRAQLVEKSKLKPKNMASCVVSLPKEGRPWRLINQALRQAEIFSLVDELSLNPMDFDYYALHLAHPYESWWKNCYADVGLPTSDTAYMHYDEDSNLIKMMVYLQPVDSTNSPFCVIPRDEARVMPHVKELFFKRLDVYSRELVSKEDWATNYYRPIFSTPKHRREFLEIPVGMQGTSHFGDDILNGSVLSRELLAKEIKIVSKNANGAIFKGGTLIHRGGMVEQGERWALQLGFRARDLSLKGQMKRAVDKAKRVIPREVRLAMKGKS
jgi:hypothetical protein